MALRAYAFVLLWGAGLVVSACTRASEDESRCRQGGGDPSSGACDESSNDDSRCGDGRVDSLSGELCDDGNPSDDDGCSGACAIEAGWTCDAKAPTRCAPICGDGLRRGAEACDDGNTITTDGCARCVVVRGYACDASSPNVCRPICGDGIFLGGEVCEDGNRAEGDGCDATCNAEVGWTCDPSTGACDAICGDGRRLGSETCDDGNTRAGDGCSPRCTRVDAWRTLLLSAAQVAPLEAGAVWSGQEIFIFGGRDWGLRGFDPVRGVWRRRARSPEITLHEHSLFWTGEELIAMTGFFPLAPTPVQGARYNPTTDTWRVISDVGAPELSGRRVSVWTGREIITWSDRGAESTGGVYDPVTDRWRPIALEGGPQSAVGLGRGVWSGRELLYFSLLLSGDLDGRAYDPALDRWRPLSAEGAPSIPWLTVLVYPPLVVRVRESIFVFPLDWDATLYSGGRYNFETDTWTPISLDDALLFPEAPSAMWTGSEMVIGAEFPETGARYDPALDMWALLPEGDAPVLGEERLAVEVAGDILVLGGDVGEGRPAWTRFDGDDHTWTRVVSDSADAPGPRLQLGTIWTGEELIVWGGRLPPPPNYGLVSAEDANRASTEHWSYSPATGAWTRLPFENAPDPRYPPVLTWTGREVLVWGGANIDPLLLEPYGSGPTNGGRYDPRAKVWSSMATGGRAPRWDTLGVFTDHELVVYSPPGTERNAPPFAAYDPARDTWRPLDAQGHADEAFVSAFWTGAEVVFLGTHGISLLDPVTQAWRVVPDALGLFPAPDRVMPKGGWGGRELLVAMGPRVARYTPSMDAWTEVLVPDAMRGRVAEAAPPVYTGALWLVLPEPNRMQTDFSGLFYDPLGDRWGELPTTNAPLPSDDRTYTWIGDAVVVWGGELEGALLPY